MRRLEEERKAGIIRPLRGLPKLHSKAIPADQRFSRSHQLPSTLGKTFGPAPEPLGICNLAPVEIIAKHNGLVTMIWSSNPVSDLLLSLTQLNSWRAMMQNMSSLGLTMENIKQADAVSPFNQPHLADIDGNIPPSLHPTSLQRARIHHPWIDPFPFPGFRDALLLREGEYSEEDLCNDLCESCTHNGSKGQVGMITWGEPWDPTSWEMTEAFARKWLWMFSECRELLIATNDWRVRRGDAELFAWISEMPYVKSL